MANPAVQSIAADIEDAARQMGKALEGITERQLRTPVKEGEWTVGEVMAHVTEAIPVWTGKCLLMAAQDHPFVGRTPDEYTRRTGILPLHANDDIATIRRRFQDSIRQALADVRRLRDSDLDRAGDRGEGRHPTARAMLDELVIGHLRDHVATVLATRQAVSRG